MGALNGDGATTTTTSTTSTTMTTMGVDGEKTMTMMMMMSPPKARFKVAFRSAHVKIEGDKAGDTKTATAVAVAEDDMET